MVDIEPHFLGFRMNTLLALCLFVPLMQDVPTCLPPSEEAVARASVLIKVLQQSGRIPPEFSEEAREKLAAMGVDVLPMILRGMKDQSENAIGLLQSAGDEIACLAAKNSIALPMSYLEKFAAHEGQQPEARRAAIRWADLQDPGTRGVFLSRHINDDVFRQEAVDAAIATGRKQCQEGQIDVARKTFLSAFEAVRSPDQAICISEELKSLSVSVPLLAQLGIVSHWRAIGPFPWTASDGFAKQWPPERQKHSEESCSVNNQEFEWHDAVSESQGVIQTFGRLAPGDHDSIVYAHTTISSEAAQSVELRVAAVGRLEVRINGETVISGDSDWTRLQHDQVRINVRLREGKNRILVKLGAMCTNTAPDAPIPPAQFCFRFVDPSGMGVHFETSH